MKHALSLSLALVSLSIYGGTAIISNTAQSGSRILLQGIRSVTRQCTSSNLCKGIVGGPASYIRLRKLKRRELVRMERFASSSPHYNSAILKTDRLVLRAWDIKKDFSAAKRLLQDPKILNTFLKYLTDEEALQWMQQQNISIQTKGYGQFACVLKESQQVIGSVGLYNPKWIPTLPWVGLWVRIIPEYQRQGYAKEAVQAVVQHGFKVCKLSEIGVYVAPGNIVSRRLLEKWGPYFGLTVSRHLLVNLKWSGKILYRLSRADWYKNRGKQDLAKSFSRIID
jgi:ribosomal-protein-alanine N-acetyltransferase